MNELVSLLGIESLSVFICRLYMTYLSEQLSVVIDNRVRTFGKCATITRQSK